MKNAHYEVTLFDFEGGRKTAIKSRDEVGDFINSLNWQEVSHFKIEPIEPLADWELELMGLSIEKGSNEH